jgi:hypothetical protein
MPQYVLLCYCAKLLPHGTQAMVLNTSLSVCTVGEVDFWICWIFYFLHFAIDVKNKTKVEKVFFFIFMSSDEEMSF